MLRSVVRRVTIGSKGRDLGEWAHIQFRGFSPEELAKFAGYGHDLNAARAEARQLLREAGVAEGLSFTPLATGVTQPFESIAVWLIDQWRAVGLNVKQEVPDRSCIRCGWSPWRGRPSGGL